MDAHLTDEEAAFFLDDLRRARTSTLEDAENASSLLTAFERLGYHIVRPTSPRGLGEYRAELIALARRSGADEALTKDPSETTISDLFGSVITGRNEHMHVGISARRLVTHAVKFSLLLEAGLMADLRSVKHFMVPNPVTAESWQTVAHLRQTMLLHQFSYLPYKDPSGWHLIPDYAVATFLRRAADLGAALAKTVGEAVPVGAIRPVPARTVRVRDNIETVLRDPSSAPLLVLDDQGVELRGILTVFDLL